MSALRNLRTQFPRNTTRYLSTSAPRTMEGTDKSHAKDPQSGSVVPQAAQEKLPKGVEQAVPDSLHDTGSSKDISGGDSIVPKAVAESLPKGVQEAVPDAIHNTSGKKST
ncbi:hypothetical protein LTR35_006929 [Friedmanniomyces endolithicus]|nr:hypothetical protein LTR35_006929 [Friedmanniomyces endolithicus]KAK0296095.1 hypothetical protein LTS00_005380 [Friedmanniomyces endolithicus]KAK0984056.1 hypothetical protein LTS01_010804 [Friedmanniomyces endolithicus]KAK0991100.1 hypothetical protein LTR54_011888 [Friedmanniomyces endolithicus]